MADHPPRDHDFDRLAECSEREHRAPSRLKSRVFSALARRQAATGPLLGLAECKAAGGELCPFEELVRIAPLGTAARSWNYCRVCHARLLAERVENAPIWWAGCPYVRFQR